MTAGNGHESWRVPDRARKYSEHRDWADTSALHSPAGDLHSDVLGRQSSDQAWPLKTSGPRWAPPRLPTQESDDAEQTWCVSTCPLPGEVKEFIGRGGGSRCICPVRTHSKQKIRRCGGDLTRSAWIYLVTQAEHFLIAGRSQNKGIQAGLCLRWQRGNEALLPALAHKPPQHHKPGCNTTFRDTLPKRIWGIYKRFPWEFYFAFFSVWPLSRN